MYISKYIYCIYKTTWLNMPCSANYRDRLMNEWRKCECLLQKSLIYAKNRRYFFLLKRIYSTTFYNLKEKKTYKLISKLINCLLAISKSFYNQECLRYNTKQTSTIYVRRYRGGEEEEKKLKNNNS